MKRILPIFMVMVSAMIARALPPPETTEPPGVLTPALQSKLDRLKQRGIDYSDALAFWPMGDGAGRVMRTFGTLGGSNAWLLASVTMDTEWVGESRLQGQSCLRFKPPLSTMHGDDRKIIGGTGKPITAYTIAGWSRPDWFRGGGMIFHEGWLAYGFSLYVAGHEARGKATAAIVQNKQNESVVSPEIDFPGGWIHSVAVYDGSKKMLSLFVNGRRVGQKDVPWEHLEKAGKGWRIGGAAPKSDLDTQGGHYNGVIDEVVVWNRALSDEEIARLYERGKSDAGTELKPVQRPPRMELTATELPTVERIVSYFDFENGIAPVIVGNGNAGRVTSAFVAPAPGNMATNKPQFRAGKFGRGLYLGSRDATHPCGEAIQCNLGDLSRDEGCVSLWFKPDWEWGKSTHQLFNAGYLQLSARVEGPRLVVTVGGDDAGKPVCLNGPASRLKQISGTKDEWHQLAVSWYRDGTAQVFLDGEAGDRAYTPTRTFGNELVFGASGPFWVGTDHDMVNNHPDATLDEVTVFDCGLSPAQVSGLYALDRPLKEGAAGFFCNEWRTAYRRGEKAVWNFNCLSRGEFGAAIVKDGDRWPILAKDEGKAVQVSFDTATLRPGDYEVETTLRDTDGKSFIQRRPLIVRQDDDPAIMFGLYAVGLSLMDESNAIAAGFQMVRFPSPSLDRRMLDRLYGKGLTCAPTLYSDRAVARLLAKRGIPVEQWRQLCWRPDGRHQWEQGNSPSPFSPVAQEAMKEVARNLVAAWREHPALLKYVCLHDELDIYRDISPAARAYFKSRTGLDALPDFNARPEGTVVPDNDPWAQWIDTFGVSLWMNQNIGVENQVCTEELHRLAPGVRTFATPSGGMGAVDVESPEIYPYLIESPLNRYLGQPELIADTSIDIYNAAQRVRPRKPLWPILGWYNRPGMPAVNESLRVLIELSLAKGAAGVMVCPDSWVCDRPDMVASVRRLADFCRRYGAMLRALRYADQGKVAVLWSEYGLMGSKNFGANYGGASQALWTLLPPLRAAGVPVELVSPADVRAGRLESCDVLVLSGYTHTTQSLQDTIMKFAGHGTVFADKASAEALLPKDAIRLDWANGKFPEPMGANTEAIRKVIFPKLKAVPILSSDWRVVAYQASGAESQVYFAINTDVHGNTTTELSIDGEDGVVYALGDESKVSTRKADGRMSWRTEIEKGGWRVYVRRAAPVADVVVKTGSVGAKASVSVQVLDKEGKPAASVPVEVRVFDASGKLTPYGMVLVTGGDGSVETSFGAGIVTDQPGKWRVEVRELLSGLSAKAPLVLSYDKP